jgi:hypothetical protein
MPDAMTGGYRWCIGEGFRFADALCGNAMSHSAGAIQNVADPRYRASALATKKEGGT